jgi:MFS family permease
MWELYAVFAYAPFLLKTILQDNAAISIWSFGFFVAGFLGCALGGLIALKIGSRMVALVALFVSGIVCMISPFLLDLPKDVALFIVLVWGVAVVADSPQFSSMNTRFAPRAYVGSALTIVNCIGFMITIITIELLGWWINAFGVRTAFLPLVFGPVFGWISLKKYSDQKK